MGDRRSQVWQVGPDAAIVSNTARSALSRADYRVRLSAIDPLSSLTVEPELL